MAPVFPDNGRMDVETAAVADRYRRFASTEAPGRSDLYASWAQCVADDAELSGILSSLPSPHRQPPLVFAVTRLLGSGDVEADAWAAWFREHADAVVRECGHRSVQTNEPLRCAALLPELTRVEGPIALLEIGASAGLCLYPDRYSYRYVGSERELRLDPVDGPSTVELVCEARGDRMPEVVMPDIVWRAGIDLNPLDVTDPRDVDWLAGLAWPGETGRADRIRAAARIASADPPHLSAGDALERLSEVAAAAPADATLVVTTPGVLVHVPRVGRGALIEAVRAAGRWITIDAIGTHDGWAPGEPDAAPSGFAVALDGRIHAFADPLGGWWEWRHG